MYLARLSFVNIFRESKIILEEPVMVVHYSRFAYCRSGQVLPVQVFPGRVSDEGVSPSVEKIEKWYSSSDEKGKKYALLPISEIIPCQRPAGSAADDRYRISDSVSVDGVNLRLCLSFVQPVRLIVFAFRNGRRGDGPADGGCRPFVDSAKCGVSTGTSVPVSDLIYQTLSKEDLLGVDPGKSGVMGNMRLHGGPFSVVRGTDENVKWHATDGTAFTCRVSRGAGGPCGTVFAKVDGGSNRKYGNVFRQTFHPAGGGGYRHVDVYVKLDECERYVQPSSSEPVGRRPLELFVGFDSPSGCIPLQGSPVGAIVAGSMEIRYG